MKRKISAFMVACIIINLLLVPNVLASDSITGTWHGGHHIGSANNNEWSDNGVYEYRNGIAQHN